MWKRYRRDELVFRLAFFILAVPVAGGTFFHSINIWPYIDLSIAFGGLLASAILTNDHIGSVKSWRQVSSHSVEIDDIP